MFGFHTKFSLEAGVGIHLARCFGLCVGSRRSLSVTKVARLGVNSGLVGGGNFNLRGDFVAIGVEEEVEDLELVMKAVVRLFWACLRWRMYFL